MTDLHVQIPDELAARLAEEAAERGVAVDVVLTELIAARLPSAQTTNHDALEAFIGFGASGITEPFDIRQARQEIADHMTTEGI